MADRTDQRPLILHSIPLSGHCHRVELLLRMLGLPFETVPADADVRKSEAFRTRNPFGQIPVLEDGDLVLADSNAILVYLALRYDPERRWLPDDPVKAARVQRWLSVAAGEVAFGPARARLIVQFKAAFDHEAACRLATRLLGLMEEHLGRSPFLAGTEPTIADLACYSYVAHAPEGGIPLDPYPAVRAWLERVEALPGFKAMPRSPIPQAA
ncbi:glutathione S-transferase family protein [Azospirillum thermophilum]|uniref:Glutathione S-transferase n=1 Tax=Azospirillum thermophilum TaxID=2202148 RepID=A0A2S2CM26_9PROT|nr:glutathione S-transferase [Azospirillum thermophilum]AWK85479.1 glutathione S-transferase [Azospirillum thermophilum]